MRAKEKVSSMQVWTEIFSVIKGSADSYKFMSRYLPQNEYMSRSSKKNNFSPIERKKIYDIFLQYESWKTNVIKGFDFMDLVNHILSQVVAGSYRGIPIHFMLCDEV